MRILCLVAVFLLAATSVSAVPPQLYKNYSYGQPRTALLGKDGLVECDNVAKDALCRDRQKFAGYADWIQALVFENGKLAMVALSGAVSSDRYTKVAGVLTNGGFLPLAMQSGDKIFDGLAILRSKGGKAYERDFGAVEVAALNSGQPLTYTFVPVEAVQKSTASTYAELVQQSAPDLRAAELRVDAEHVIVRFLAPTLALKDLLEKLQGQKENF